MKKDYQRLYRVYKNSFFILLGISIIFILFFGNAAIYYQQKYQETQNILYVTADITKYCAEKNNITIQELGREFIEYSLKNG